MDDLEKAILISFDESGAVNSALKEQAIAFIRQIKESPSICCVCMEKLCFSKLVQVQFWSLQCLHEVIRLKYSSMTSEEKSFIRKSVFSMACCEPVHANDVNSVRILDSPPFIKNKLAQVVVALIYFEYPLIWPSVFVDFLPNLSKGPVVIDMFCRILNALDDELISMDYPRSGDEVVVSGRIKDAMRAQCVPQIVGAWYDIVLMYRNSDPELCSSVLSSMRRYISWIDIGLVANDAFTQLLFELMLVDGLLDQIRAAAAGVVLAVVSKRMDFKSKLALLQSLQIRRVFGLVARDGDSELVSSVASLLTGYATEVLECSKRLSSEDGKGVSIELLNEVLPSVFYVIQNCEVDAALSIVQFLSVYVGTMRSISALTETQLFHVGQILEVIRGQIQFGPMYRHNLDVLDNIGREEEDRMVEFRKDLFVLLRSIARVAPDLTHVFIRNSLASAVSSSEDRNAEEVEASLSLFYALGESLSDDVMKSGSGVMGELVPMLLSTTFPCHSNRLVALVYLDTITRYIKFVSENTQYIPIALHAFLDERGVHHPNVNVSRRASYLFMRVVKLLKAKLVPYIEMILQSLQDIVAQFTRTGSASKELSGSEDGSHIFEAIGLLIGTEDVPLEKQSEYLSALLTPLCQQVEVALLNAKSQNPEQSAVQIENIQQIIMAINALSKGFSERLVTASRPEIGLMFKKTLDILLQILVVFPTVEPLRCKVTSFIHRMVDTLGASVFPYLPKALGELLPESEPKELVGFLVLLNQLICKFGTLVRDILEEVYPAIASRALSILPRSEMESGPGSCAEEIRELQELQRIFFTFLHVIATHELSSVFLCPQGIGCFNMMMQLLLDACCNHKDILIRKACVQIFIRLIKDWCAGPYGEEKVPGFRSFITETFAMRCCLYSVLDKSFEFRDANTVSSIL
ncbi:Nuclear mRNA export factor receptor LOS1/Exportin-t (importin beta superfamily) [Handroanthus impetiginosus]|uniref:Exportin-T n=1 Tax=Handroanthus impetiginosus TaxID=429701 RepID=A0A2G9GCC3_9LAMI|nr:Nuclear mRNA export factor receptor LOS1/Exportin-t (importin beta superfamily) [Handroanthus impetiginosus]